MFPSHGRCWDTDIPYNQRQQICCRSSPNWWGARDYRDSRCSAQHIFSKLFQSIVRKDNSMPDSVCRSIPNLSTLTSQGRQGVNEGVINPVICWFLRQVLVPRTSSALSWIFIGDRAISSISTWSNITCICRWNPIDILWRKRFVQHKSPLHYSNRLFAVPGRWVSTEAPCGCPTPWWK